MNTIHQTARDAISWPARLHASEFGGDGRMYRYLRVWLAQLQSYPSCISAQESAGLQQKKGVLTSGVPSVAKWPGDVRRWVKPASLSYDEADLIGRSGGMLRDESRGQLKQGLQSVCGQEPVYFVAGHTDGRLKAEPAYRQCAEYVARIVKALGVSEITLYVAKPELGTPTLIETLWSEVMGGVGLVAKIHRCNYDDGPAGLWIADSLLHWALQSGKAPLFHRDHKLGERCVLMLSGAPASVRGLEDVCKKTQKLLGLVTGGISNV